MFKSHLKFAFKSVRKHKVPSFINLLGFTIGLTGSILLLSILLHDANFDGYHQSKDKLFRLTTKLNLPNGERHFASSSVLTGQNLSEVIPEVETSIRTRYLQSNLELGDKVFSNEPMLFVDSGFYKGFKVDIIEGSTSDELNDILISTRAKERLFGEEEAVGEVIQAQGPFGLRNFQVAGVFQSYPTNVSFRPSFLANFELIEPLHNANYAAIMPGLDTYILTNSRVGQNALQVKLDDHFQEALPENVREVIVHEAQPFSSIHFTRGLEFDQGQKHDKQTLWVLGVLAIFIISSTVINFFNMQTALAVQRIKELSIKKALGQPWLSNVLQSAQEAMIILLPAVLLSGLLLSFSLNELESYTSLDLKTGWLSDEQIWIFLGAIFGVLWLIASIISIVLIALTGKRMNLSRSNSGSSIFRKSLIGLQFALAGFFILNALVISRQLNYINSLDMGYHNDGLVNVSLNEVDGYEHALTIKNAFSSIAGIKDATVSQSAIFGNQGKSNFSVQVDTGSVSHLLNVNYIDVDFVRTNRMSIIAGEDIRQGGRTMLINEKAVDALGFKDSEDALGKQVTWSGRDTSLVYQISGVISDYHYTTMHQAIEPIVLMENELSGYFSMTLRVEGASFEPVIEQMEAQWDELFLGHELSYRIMEDVLDRAYEEDFQKADFYQWATMLLVAIAALGIFGLTYYYADQKRKEIGVRKAIGARLFHIIRQIAQPIVLVCLLAVIIAVPIGVYFSQQWLNGYEYGIEVGVLEIGLTVTLMFVLSSIALLYPGIKASRINPVEALRED